MLFNTAIQKFKTVASCSRCFFFFFYALLCRSVSAVGRVEQVRRPSHSRWIPVEATALCKRAGVGGVGWGGVVGGGVGGRRSGVKAVRDAHLIQESYAVPALGGGKCVKRFIGRAF